LCFTQRIGRTAVSVINCSGFPAQKEDVIGAAQRVALDETRTECRAWRAPPD
jgi:hypothetical protein